MLAPRGLRTLTHGLVSMLMVRGTVGGGFHFKDISKAVQAVGKDPSKVQRAAAEVQQVVEQAAEGPGKAVGKAVTNKGVDASRAVGAAKDAAQSVSAGMPTVSINVGGDTDSPKAAPEGYAGSGTAAPGSGESTTALPEGANDKPPDQVEKVKKVVSEGPIGNLLRGKNIGGTIKGVTAGHVIETIAKTHLGKIEDLADQVTEHGQNIAQATQNVTVKDIGKAVSESVPSSAWDEVTDRAKGTGDTISDNMQTVTQKARSTNISEAVEFANSGEAKKIAASVRNASLMDLLANPSKVINTGKAKPADGAKDEPEDEPEDGGSFGNSLLVTLLVFVGLVFGGHMLFRHFNKPRPVGGLPMLNGDSEQHNVMMTGHWMGSNAREVVTNSMLGGNPGGFTASH